MRMKGSDRDSLKISRAGLTGVQPVISDCHTGIQKAAKTAFLSASWQTRKTHFIFVTGRSKIYRVCSVHCTRMVLRNISRKCQKEVAECLRETYGNEQKLQDLADDPNAWGYRKATNAIEQILLGLMSHTTGILETVLSLPVEME
jgi:putative transposase